MVALYAFTSVFAKAPIQEDFSIILHGGGERAVMYSDEWWGYIGISICKWFCSNFIRFSLFMFRRSHEWPDRRPSQY
jgi:hypothetical protein